MTHAYAAPAEGAVTIPLTNSPGDHALFDAADWRAWQDAGKPTCLYLNESRAGGCTYVAYSDASAPGGLSYAARWIMQPKRGQVVKYRSGNRADLRRANLYLVNRALRKRLTPATLNRASAAAKVSG